MELLLNLAWLLLALPACWLWRERIPVRKSSLQCLLALGCLLVVLFPVVSATDDLQAMRAEMEESPAINKRSLRQASDERVQLLAWQSPAQAVSAHTFSSIAEEWYYPRAFSQPIPAAPAIKSFGRGPPRSWLA